jgi:glutathione peroxidase
MNFYVLAFFLFSLTACDSSEQNNKTNTTIQSNNTQQMDSLPSIHQFTIESLDGGKIDFSAFKGKKILVVNTASECGYTPQYKELQALYIAHQEHLVVVGVPANDFGGQEPGTNAEIGSFCQKNYGVTFPMAAKSVVTGENACSLYQWLTKKANNGVLDATITWNFNKFLLNEEGKLIKKMDSKVKPNDPEILDLL